MSGVLKVRQSLSKAAADAKDWFLSASVARSREDFDARGRLGDDGTGAVYAYFDKKGDAVYVGETSRPIKRRMHDRSSPHKEAEWWGSWSNVHFVQLQDRTDRLALELLLVLSLRPKFNSKPGPRPLAAMFTNRA